MICGGCSGVFPHVTRLGGAETWSSLESGVSIDPPGRLLARSGVFESRQCRELYRQTVTS